MAEIHRAIYDMGFRAGFQAAEIQMEWPQLHAIENILKFHLYETTKEWQAIEMLFQIRNAFVHANGRLEMLNEKTRKKIEFWVKQNIGLTVYYGFLVCEERFVFNTFQVVRKSLGSLIGRYKIWEDNFNQEWFL